MPSTLVVQACCTKFFVPYTAHLLLLTLWSLGNVRFDSTMFDGPQSKFFGQKGRLSCFEDVLTSILVIGSLVHADHQVLRNSSSVYTSNLHFYCSQLRHLLCCISREDSLVAMCFVYLRTIEKLKWKTMNSFKCVLCVCVLGQ